MPTLRTPGSVRFSVATVRNWATIAFLGGLLVGLLAALVVLAL